MCPSVSSSNVLCLDKNPWSAQLQLLWSLGRAGHNTVLQLVLLADSVKVGSNGLNTALCYTLQLKLCTFELVHVLGFHCKFRNRDQFL